MTAPTHITFAEFIYLLILTTTGVSLSAVNASVIAISSLLPDVDTQASTLGRIIPIISTRLERRFGHRTLTHSLPCLVTLGVVALPLYALSHSLYACFITGYASHSFLDTMTVNGVKLFYPFSSVKCVFPFEVNNPHRYRLQTGSKLDKMLSVIFLIGCIPTFVVAYEGYERFVRTTQQNVEAAARDFNEFSRDHFVLARVAAHNALTKQPLNGQFEIIGALDPHTLVFRSSDGRPHTLGREFQSDFVVENIICFKGEPARPSIRNIDVSNQLLVQVTSCVDSASDNYFFGDLSTSDKVSLPENIRMFTPVTGSGSTIRLNFATCDDIYTFNLEYIFITKGILTIKSISRRKLPAAIDESGSSLPKLEKFTQISAMLDAKESVTLLKARGDTIHAQELLAKKISAKFFEDEIDLNREKIAALESGHAATISDLDEKIVHAEQAVEIDSMEYERNLELVRNHFVSGASLPALELKRKKENQIVEQLIESRSAHNAKTDIEMKKLQIQHERLGAGARAADLQSEIRSTVNGILLDIRRVPHENKIQLTFIIRRRQ